MHRTGLTLTVAVALLCGGASAAAAQSHDPVAGAGLGSPAPRHVVDDRSEPDSTWSGPTARAVTLLATTVTAPASRAVGRAPAPLMPQTRNRRGVPYMVAGGILFIAGAIVEGDGGTLLMLGGAGIGAYGAFVYFGG